LSTTTVTELRRRTLVKSIVWRLIGVVWTWVGAYLIVLIVPAKARNAPVIATLVVAYHHSTRMVMYYAYERYWAGISWGKYDPRAEAFCPMSRRDKLLWTLGTAIAVLAIFLLIVYVGPLVKRA